MFPRRAVLAGLAALAAAPRGAAAQTFQPSPEDRRDIARVEAYFEALRTLRARFVQVSDQGAVAEGRLFIQRPGRLRLDYADPAKLLIVATGGQLIQHDRELKQTTYLLLSLTPAAVLLRERVTLSGDVTVTGVARATGTVRISVVQTSDPRAGRITLVFGDRPFQLSSWIDVDGQGATTRVTLSEIETGMALDPQLFVFREEDSGRSN
jgi:outer membrane lipoprotein-sorting protein